MATVATAKLRKSVPLTDDQVKRILESKQRFETKTEWSFAMKVNADVMERAVLKRTCNEATFRKLFPNDPLP